MLRAIRFALTHSKDLEEAIKNFDEITGGIGKKTLIRADIRKAGQ